MNPNAKRLVAGAIAIALVTAVLGWVAANFSDNAARLLCNDNNIKSMQNFVATTNNEHEKRDMQQQIKVCQGKDLDKGDSALEASIGNSGSTATPTATATATPKATPKEKHWYDPFDPSKEQFYANWPATYKNSANAYGPKKPLAPSLQGKEMEKLNANQAYTEHMYVIDRDRMQTASAMVYLGLTKKDVNALIDDYMKDAKLWKHDREVVKKKLSDMNRRVENTKAGTHTTTLRALPGTKNGAPIVDSIDVTYPVTTRWVVYKDSKTGKEFWFRLICKFQPRLFTETPQIPKAPPTRPHITRTHEGTPVLLVDVCRKVNGTWMKVFDTKKQPGDRSLNSSKCHRTPTTPPTTTPPKKVPVCINEKIVWVPKSEAHKYPKPNANGTCAKVNHDPNTNGNAGNGGGHNQNPGPGATTTPSPHATTPRTNPSTPTSTPTTTQSPAPAPETSAPKPTEAPTVCSPAHGRTCP